MVDITAIILTKNEEVNIQECINSVKDWVKRIVVVDSGSTDKTVKIAEKNGAEVFYHPWKHYANQFNWALTNTEINTKWILRLDADERITKELAIEISRACESHLDDDVNGFLVNHRLYFLGKYLKYGGSTIMSTKVFKFEVGKFEERAMGEHIILSNGNTILLDNYCLHHDFKDLHAYIDKHNSYASREVIDYYERKNKLKQQAKLYSHAETTKKLRDGIYYKLPKFIRARIYYWFRYYIQKGFLDGRAGQIYCYIQAYMYRYIIDAKIYECEVYSQDDL